MNKFRLFLVACFTLLVFTLFPFPAKADVIYHAFNMPFQEVKAKLPEIKAQGYTYIQISPPQKSNPSSEWWGRYQPLDFEVLDSPLGNEKDLKELIAGAHQQGEKIIVDVVLNHMADYPPYSTTLEYPQFSPQDFHSKDCISNYDDRYQVTHGWLGLDCNNISQGSGLPDLNTESPHVRQEGKEYLTKLLDLGADGFRFDAIKHMETDYLKDILSIVPSDIYIYGEIVEGKPDQSYLYTGIRGIDISDYSLLGTLKEAFSYGGDLRSLIDPHAAGKALPGPNAVTFAKTHDTVKGSDLYSVYGFEERDGMLANAYVLARQEGLPLIYKDDADASIVQAGVTFHEQMLSQPQYFRNSNEISQGADSPNLLFIERGNKGLAIINKGGNFFDVPVAKMPGLDEGCYQELQYGFTMSVGISGDGQKYVTSWGTPERGGIKIGPRDALFFVKNAGSQCQ